MLVRDSYSQPVYQRYLSDIIYFIDLGVDELDNTRIGLFDKNKKQIGDLLTDLSWTEDYNRYHDVYHFAKDQILQYSPVIQSVLGQKTAPRDVSADEASIAVIQNAFKNESLDSDKFRGQIHIAYTMIYDHHLMRPERDLFEKAMINAHEVFQDIVMIKKHNNKPMKIAVKYDREINRIGILKAAVI